MSELDLSGVTWSDTNGDGVGDVGTVDADGNGVAEFLAVDSNLDGHLDAVGWDADQNGLSETVEVDTDGNGDLDTTAWDTNGNGQLDVAVGPATGGVAAAMAETGTGPAPSLNEQILGGTVVGGTPTNPNPLLSPGLAGDPLVNDILRRQSEVGGIWVHPEHDDW